MTKQQQLVSCWLQVSGHRSTHDAGADEADDHGRDSLA